MIVCDIVTGKNNDQRLNIDQWPHDSLATLKIHGRRAVTLDLSSAIELRNALAAFIRRGPVLRDHEGART